MVSVAVEEKGSLTTCHDLKTGITLTFSRKNWHKPWKICQGITLIFLLKSVSIVQVSLHPQLTSCRVHNWLNMVICYNTHMLLHRLLHQLLTYCDSKLSTAFI